MREDLAGPSSRRSWRWALRGYERSSIGRAPVSKTGGWGFDSLRSCSGQTTSTTRAWIKGVACLVLGERVMRAYRQASEHEFVQISGSGRTVAEPPGVVSLKDQARAVSWAK